jgi:hypothetical protein
LREEWVFLLDAGVLAYAIVADSNTIAPILKKALRRMLHLNTAKRSPDGPE